MNNQYKNKSQNKLMPKEDQKERAKQIITTLKKQYGLKNTALKYKTIHQLLVATILSAQCTDKRVNIITQELFEKYPDIGSLAQAELENIETIIRSTGFYHNKAKNIINASKMIVEEFNGKVPDTMQDLLKLPGVARKTANIVLTDGYGKNEGIAVDTHVKRLSNKLGFTKSKDPDKIEKDLMKIISKEEWKNVTNVLINHGRNTCIARNPKCDICAIKEMCPSRKE